MVRHRDCCALRMGSLGWSDFMVWFQGRRSDEGVGCSEGGVEDGMIVE